MNYERSDDEKELKMVPIVGQNNNKSDVLRDSNSNSDNKSQENLFDKDINKEVEMTPKTTFNTKVVWALKKLQASNNNDANKTVKQATHVKGAIKNLNFLIDLAMLSNDIKLTMEEPQTFNEAWNHPINESCRKWQEAFCKECSNMNKQQVQ